MRSTYINIILSVTFFCSCAQKSTDNKSVVEDSLIYQKNVIAFINEIYLMTDTLFVLNKAVDRIPNTFLNGLMEDDFFSKEEKKIIKDKLYPTTKEWKQDLFPSVRLINEDSLNTLIASMSYIDRFDYIDANFNTGVHSFAYPIFLRDYTYCLFYGSNLKNGIGEGNLILYKLKNGRWVIERELWEWIT